MTGNGERDTKTLTLTLEAFADTIIPGAKRFPGDRAVAGASDTPGAVEAGAIELLETPATGIAAGLEPLSQVLNQHAANYAERTGLTLADDVPAFVALPFEHRTALVAELTTPGHPEKDGWVVLALFANMAYDTAAHLNTGAALEAGHPGLLSMGFAKPDDDGLWRFRDFTYGRKLADIHPKTTESGSPA